MVFYEENFYIQIKISNLKSWINIFAYLKVVWFDGYILCYKQMALVEPKSIVSLPTSWSNILIDSLTMKTFILKEKCHIKELIQTYQSCTKFCLVLWIVEGFNGTPVNML